MNINKVIMSAFLLTTSTGCSGLTFSTHDVVFAGQENGVDSMTDYVTGVAIVAKTPRESMGANALTLMRMSKEVEKTNRERFRFMSKQPVIKKGE